MATAKTTLKLSLPEARDVLATLWASGGQPDQRLRKQVGYDLKELDLALSGAISILRSKGKLRADTATDGTPLLVLGPGGGTLRDIIEPFYASVEVASSTKTWVRQALHSWLALPDTSPREDLYAACETVSMLDVYELPESVYQSAVADGNGVKKAPSWKSALRAAMTWAAKQPGSTIALPEEWCRINDEVTTRTMRALARVWSDGVQPSIDAIKEAGGPAPGSVSRRINEMVARDLAAVQPHEKRGVTLLWINFSDHSAEAATLGDAIQAILASSEINSRSKRDLTSALRARFGMPYAPESRLLEACRGIPCSALHGWAGEVQKALIEKGYTSKQARDNASSIRTMLRWAAEHRVIPMFFSDRLADPWTEVKNRWIPLKRSHSEGISRETRFRYRTAWNWYSEAIIDLYGRVHPDEVTAEMADCALDWNKERGRYDRVNHLLSMLNWIARRGFGPYQKRLAVLAGDPLLKGRDGDGCATYEGLLDAFDFHQLPAAWREFFIWYRLYVTLPEEELRKAMLPDGTARFPRRPEVRHLGEKTLAVRVKAVRWVLGITRDFLGIDLQTLPLHEAFGKRHLARVFDAGRDIWQTRHNAGELSSPCGTSIRHYIQGAGLVAEALYARLRHQYGDVVSESTKKNVGVDLRVEEGKVKTADQELLWGGYVESLFVSSTLTVNAKDFGDAPKANTQKSIAELIRLTPPEWYWKVYRKSLELAKRSLETDGISGDHHRLIRDVYAFGVLISTGMRGDELGHVRLDLQYPHYERGEGGKRCVRLNRRDRKNDREHTCVIQEKIVPRWLEDAYLLRSRPCLMRKLNPTTSSWGLSRDDAHNHLIVDNEGRALGCVEELQDRKGRDGRAMELRINAFREGFKNRFGRIAWEHCGLRCPTKDGYFTLHSIRNVFGHFHFQGAKLRGNLDPRLAAANYLGDDPKQVLDTYGALDATRIDPEIYDQIGPAEGHLPANAVGPTPINGELSLYAALQAAEEETRNRCASWGLTESATEAVWADRAQRILHEHTRGTNAA